MKQKNDKLLTFELNKDKDGIEIHGNIKGLRYLSNILLKIINDNVDNEHLMTESWGGGELSDEKLGIDNEIINHVKIFNWNK